MKEKRTLTVECSAIARAKAYAKREGTSLSKLVEQQFNGLGLPTVHSLPGTHR